MMFFVDLTKSESANNKFCKAFENRYIQLADHLQMLLTSKSCTLLLCFASVYCDACLGCELSIRVLALRRDACSCIYACECICVACIL